jgi:hypothetical protein
MNRFRKQRVVRLLAAGIVCATTFPSAWAAGADDAFVCMEETQEKCDYENTNLDLFVKGRDAYARGRETGDLNEARNIALELMSRKDARHGKLLMKYIYMQVGQGVHKNLVESYRWVTSDLAAGASYSRLDLERVRGSLVARMSPEQLVEARK